MEGYRCLNLAKYKGGPSKSRTPASATKPPKKVFRDSLSDAPVETFTTKRHRKTIVEKTRFRDNFREPKSTQNDPYKNDIFLCGPSRKRAFQSFCHFGTKIG